MTAHGGIAQEETGSMQATMERPVPQPPVPDEPLPDGGDGGDDEDEDDDEDEE